MFKPLGHRRSADARVEVNLGAGAVSIPPLLKYLDLTGRGLIPVPVEGPVDWTQLENIPGCVTIEWDGPERGVIEALRAQRIKFFYWHNAEGDVDLTQTFVTQVRLGGAGLRSVTLPRWTERLQLRDPPPDLRVQAPHLPELQVFCARSEITIPQGLHHVRRLWLRAPRGLSLSTVNRLAELEELSIVLERPPGSLTDLHELLRHKRLHLLEIVDAFDWDPHSLPDLPSLRRLEIHGTRRSTAAVLKARYGGTAIEVAVRGAKSDKWLAEHMDNPFRDWVHESKPFGVAACKAYNAAAARVGAGDAEPALRGLVTDLNALHADFGLIDTVLREHAWDAFLNLAKRAGVSQRQASLWFDDGRQF